MADSDCDSRSEDLAAFDSSLVYVRWSRVCKGVCEQAANFCELRISTNGYLCITKIVTSSTDYKNFTLRKVDDSEQKGLELDFNLAASGFHRTSSSVEFQFSAAKPAWTPQPTHSGSN